MLYNYNIDLVSKQLEGRTKSSCEGTGVHEVENAKAIFSIRNDGRFCPKVPAPMDRGDEGERPWPISLGL